MPPSGTADRLLEIILQSRNSSEQEISHGRQGIPGERKPNEVGSHALRGGDIVGEHTVLFAGMGERIELTHRATDRIIFASGALKAANCSIQATWAIFDARCSRSNCKNFHDCIY